VYETKVVRGEQASQWGGQGAGGFGGKGAGDHALATHTVEFEAMKPDMQLLLAAQPVRA